MRPSLSAALSLSFLLLTSLLTSGPARAQGGSGAVRHRGPTLPPQPQSIAFGEHRLTLGMPKDEVMEKLGQSHEVKRWPDDRQSDVWSVSKSGEPYGGKITFEGGVLVRVTQDWEVAEPTAGPPMTMMKIALAAMHQMIPEDVRDCEVGLALDGPGYLAISCGKMLVQVGISSSEGEPDRVWVYKVLGTGLTGSEKEAGRLARPSPVQGKKPQE
jgi:hypothetical protein